MDELHESGVFGLLEPAQQPVLHHGDELAVAQLIVH